MNKSDLLIFMRLSRIAVQASASLEGSVQSAMISIAVSDAFEIVFDTMDATRKVRNLRMNPKIAFVIGGWQPGDERSVQYEGIVDEPRGSELERIKEVYYGSFPEGRNRRSWPGLIYMRVRPIWIRYIDHAKSPRQIVQFDEQQLKASK